MADDAPLDPPDQVPGLPHPRETFGLFGQDEAERAFLGAWASERLHHAWLLSGPEGVGKATLAYRIARTRIAAAEGGLFGAPEPPETLAMAAEDPVARRISAGAEPLLSTLIRTEDPKAKPRRLRTQIVVDDVRKLKSFFQLTSAEGGWRVAIIDPAEEMNPSAANALLKLLEEPPARSLFLLVSHAPSRLLPTIRSRCRHLPLKALGAEDLTAALTEAGVETGGEDADALKTLCAGSAGRAARLLETGGVRLYQRLVRLALGAPGADRREMNAIADGCAGRDAAAIYDLTLKLIDILLARLARAAALGAPQTLAAPDEAALFARLAASPDAARIWADLAANVSAETGRARAVNLDPGMVILDTFIKIDAAARKTRALAA